MRWIFFLPPQTLIGPASSLLLCRLSLALNDAKAVKLKHRVASLEEPDYRDRKDSITQTVDAEQFDDSLALGHST